MHKLKIKELSILNEFIIKPDKLQFGATNRWKTDIANVLFYFIERYQNNKQQQRTWKVDKQSTVFIMEMIILQHYLCLYDSVIAFIS